MTVFKPGALDFARLLHARQEFEDHAQLYLFQLQEQLGSVMEQRGYQEVRVRPLVDAPAPPDVAAAATVVVLARLPLEGLRSPVFKVQLPLVVTHSGQLTLQEAQINRFTVAEPFVQPLSIDGTEMADLIVQFLSERYMEHLLQVRQ